MIKYTFRCYHKRLFHILPLTFLGKNGSGFIIPGIYEMFYTHGKSGSVKLPFKAEEEALFMMMMTIGENVFFLPFLQQNTKASFECNLFAQDVVPVQS